MSGSSVVTHLTREQLESGLDDIRLAPRDVGTLKMIVRRPAVNQREVVEAAELDLSEGLVGDTWAKRGSSRSVDGKRHPDMQLNIIGARTIALIAQAPERWPLAGDQLYVDLDLSEENLPAGTRLAIGSAVVEVTAEPHTGCGKFVERFGIDAMKFVNAPLGRSLRLRGLNARVVTAGVIRAGDQVRKLTVSR
jgi:hypothetical protein